MAERYSGECSAPSDLTLLHPSARLFRPAPLKGMKAITKKSSTLFYPLDSLKS
jgi:hypothetical protein